MKCESSQKEVVKSSSIFRVIFTTKKYFLVIVWAFKKYFFLSYVVGESLVRDKYLGKKSPLKIDSNHFKDMIIFLQIYFSAYKALFGQNKNCPWARGHGFLLILWDTLNAK